MYKNNETIACDIQNFIGTQRKKEIVQLQGGRHSFRAELMILIAIVY